MLYSKATLPGWIGIEKLPGRAERGNHLSGVLEEVAVPLLRFALRLLAVQVLALIHGNCDHSGQLAERIAKRRNVQRDGNLHAVPAAHLGVKAGYHAGSQHANTLQIGRHEPRTRRFRRPLHAAEFLHLGHQAFCFAGRKNVHCAPQFKQLRGAIAQHTLSGGIAVDQPAAQIQCHYCRTRRVEELPQSFSDRFTVLNSPGAEQPLVQEERE